MDAIDPLLLVTQPVGELFNELTRRGADSGQLEEAVYNPQLPLTGSRDTDLQQFAIEGFPPHRAADHIPPLRYGSAAILTGPDGGEGWLRCE